MKKTNIISGLILTMITFSVVIENQRIAQDIYLSKSNDILDFLKKDILENSQLFSTEQKVIYNGKEYSSKNELLYEFFEQNPIVLERTYSDPNKIIDNFSTNQLDSKKVFSSDPKSLIPVYINSMNKIVLPSCFEYKIETCVESNKTARQRTLDNYVNLGMFKPRYSYDFQNWFDSPKEAEINFKNTYYDVQSSLFYNNEGYYNAFGKNVLNGANIYEGIYYDAFENIINQSIEPITKSFFKRLNTGDNNDFFSYFTREFKSYIANNINKILFANYQYEYQIDAGKGENTKNQSGNDLTQWFSVKSNSINGLEITATPHVKNQSGKLIVRYQNNIAENSNFKWSIFNNYISNQDNWKYYGITTTRADSHQNSYFDYIINNQKLTVDLKISADQSGVWTNDKGYNKTLPKNIKTADNISINNESLNFEILKEDDLFKQFSSRYELSKIDDKKLINKLSSDNGSWNEKEIIKEITNSHWLSNISEAMIKSISEFLVQEIIDKLLIETQNNNNVYKAPFHNDYIYGNDNYSYYKTKKDFDDKFKNDISQTEKDVNYTYQGVNFTTSYKNWKENFMPLVYQNGTGIKLERKYFVSDSSKDIGDFEDSNGMFLGSSIGEAKDLYYKYDYNTLKKMYYVYDINGKEYKLDTSDEKEAKAMLESQISKQYKFVHKDELNTLRDQQTDIEDLITTGEHVVYKFKNEDNNFVYYKDYESAYNAYISQISINEQINLLSVDQFIYTFAKDNKTTNYYWWKEEQIDDIAKEIYNKYYFN